ncbi:sterol desaturase family protein [Paraglaciecola aquimarina]|uniref:Sterol desaturase family protein n=1 Tax=Paraglaciecola algarum TaxID=3050085 RepID=A0ABS9D1Y2_9ALTE|nr:sterol desaturase family protein [Paraglaciecola sp. G1-23]MCF2946910.1 sterol desaturase family protein [Paraglaciecola sp. G1-23]
MPTPLEVLLDPLSLGLLTLYAIIIVLEALFPARKLPAVKGWYLRSAGVFIVYFYLSTYLPMIWDQYLIPYQLIDLSHINHYVGTFVALVLFELFVYVWHRTMHQTKWLWLTFHQMHHSAERLDTFGTFYYSPLDMAGFTFLGSLTLALGVGLSAEAITLFLYVSMFLVLFQHANIKTPRWIGYLIQRPESHSVHHQKGVHAYNYSDFPIFDILFGTFKNPKEFNDDIGFYDGASARIGEMLIAKDVYKPEAKNASELA